MSPVISRRTARLCLDILVPDRLTNFAIRELEKALKPKRSVKLAKVRKTATRQTQRVETRGIRAALEKRAGGRCECGCGIEFDEQNGVDELDHFFGRVRVHQATPNTWLLRRDCHRAKTNNMPDASFWLRKFIRHCDKHAYASEGRMAQGRLEALALSRGVVGP